MTGAELELGLALIEIIRKAAASLKRVKEDSPEVYAEIEKHHADVLAQAEAIAKQG